LQDSHRRTERQKIVEKREEWAGMKALLAELG